MAEPLVGSAFATTPASGLDPALGEFYAGDPRRWLSREVDLGLRWRARDGSTYRAAWIAATNELYTVRHGDRGERGRVKVLARLGAGTLWRALAGWREACSGAPGSYEWLRARLALTAGAPAG